MVSKLKDLHITENTQEEMLHDIFGTISDSQHQLGLVDSSGEDEFDSNLARVQSRWDNLGISNCRTLGSENHQPQFHAWFVKHKANC